MTRAPRILFGLAGGIGNSIFCLPAIKKLSRIAEVSLFVEADYPSIDLWKRCRYVEGRVYKPGDDLPEPYFDELIAGQYAPKSRPFGPWMTNGFPRGESAYRVPEWQIIAWQATGSSIREDVSDAFEIPKLERFELTQLQRIPFVFVNAGKPGEEWARKLHPNSERLFEVLCRAFGQGACCQGIDKPLPEPFGDLKMPLIETARYLQASNVAIGTDCGPMHLVSALGVPCVFLFYATSKIKGDPVGAPEKNVKLCLDVPCSPCQSTSRWGSCKNWICREIPDEEVVRFASDLLLRHPPAKVESGT